MFGDISWLNIGFRLLNFGVVIAVGYYLYRRYMYAQVEQTIQEQETLQTGLEELGSILEGQIAELDDELLSQDRYAARLKAKVMEWQQAVARQQEKEQERRELQQQRLYEHMQQLSVYAAQRTQRRMLEQAIIKAEQRLKERFSSPAEQQRYISEIFSTLERI